jgi:hydrogenase maturation protease
LTPAGVLHVAQRLGQPIPEAWQLAIEGESFGLGEGLSEAARVRLGQALRAAERWMEDHRAVIVRSG